jgi:hypothetical protein
VCDHDIAEMATALKVAIGLLCVGEPENPVDHRAQCMAMARFIASKSSRLPTLIEASI